MDRVGSDTERRLRAMETAFQRERQQRDLLEKKYARLKRRYVRLERAHSRLLTESHGKTNNGLQSPSTQSATPGSVESSPNAGAQTFSVIDLTSPRPGSSSAVTSTNGSRESIARSWRSSGPAFPRDEICGESPNSSLGSPHHQRESLNIDDQEEKESEDSWRHTSGRTFDTSSSRRRLHLDFTLPPSLTDSNRALLYPRQQQRALLSDQLTSSHSSPQSERSVITHTAEPRNRARSRPRLHHHSPERTAARAYGYELEQELLPRTHHHDRYRWMSEPSPERSTPSPVESPRLNSPPLPPPVPSPATRPRAESDEEASLALARYLQQQENIAAYEEYEARQLRESVEQEYNQHIHAPNSALLAGLVGQQHHVDPDNMTYEELLRLGEEVGDVKKERWRRMAVQVLSSLPTHRWTSGQADDTCIVCQYNFVPNDRAMTLPCAHVFHEDCVGGWIRENNSCPLCKREITPM